MLGYAVAVAGFVWVQAGIPPHRAYGDCWEYWYQVESLARHGTPELRPADRAAVDTAAAELGLESSPLAPHAYERTPDGRLYGVHPWAYALSAVPARLALGAAGGPMLASLRVANALWVAAAVGVALFGSRAPLRERFALVGLATIGPAVWYLDWAGAELYSWSLGLMAVVAYRDRRYPLAALAAGLAAIQNPPAGLFAAAAVLAAASAGRWRSAAWAVAGAAVSLLPYAFYQYHYGQPSLIVNGPEYAGVRNVSWARTWGLATDLNHGLLPYQPGLLLLALFGAIRIVLRPTRHRLLFLAGAAAMGLSCQVAHNWNSACEGLQRYLVWMLPAVAAVAVEGLGGRWGKVVAVVVGLHAVLLIAHQASGLREAAHLSQTPAAEWMLTHYPELYRPDFETFVERTNNADGWPYRSAPLPLGFVRPADGSVSKLLVDPATADRLGDRYDVDPAHVAELVRRAAGERGLFFAHPPRGAVHFRPPAE